MQSPFDDVSMVVDLPNDRLLLVVTFSDECVRRRERTQIGQINTNGIGMNYFNSRFVYRAMTSRRQATTVENIISQHADWRPAVSSFKSHATRTRQMKPLPTRLR